eukprot:TRINITY_DN28711_c0_g1_i1.p3 TRINITY_DN28711_c0_g1~~TRINITY_DN28711_c0_g1_i1.p3  ORF type:complete len:108 (+),score=45.92 TRINITY_DN28711_c0_g1_i1:143-466(+)
MQRGLVGSEMCIRDRDSDKLLNLLLEFKKQGISSILISHKLNEVERVADSITILRDGATIETLDCSDGGTVSYTHLTLPTILLVQISVVAVSLKKKRTHTDLLCRNS